VSPMVDVGIHGLEAAVVTAWVNLHRYSQSVAYVSCHAFSSVKLSLAFLVLGPDEARMTRRGTPQPFDVT